MTTIAITHTWPDIKNAEYEVLQRFINASELISVSTIVVDRYGKILWHSENIPAIIGQTIRKDQAEFLISLHFESPKVVDIYSYYALWQPIEFYSLFDYERTIKNLASYDDLLSCDSDIADAHGINILSAMGRHVMAPLPRIYHTLPQPFLTPKIDAYSRVLYVGINWERLGKPKGRFHDALLTLAKKDLVDIYGPERLLGVAPWEGFPAYQGELPFDGEAIKYALNRTGICLALSSKAHVETGIMSNRLFEGFAGGAAVICNNNPFVAKHFADEVYVVDSDKGDESLAMQIAQIVRKIRADPDEANDRVLRAQVIMQQKFALEQNLKQLVSCHRLRKEFSETKSLIETTITIIVDYRGCDIVEMSSFLESLRSQTRVSIYLNLLCDVNTKTLAEANATIGGSLKAVFLVPLPSRRLPKRFDGFQPSKVRRGRIVANILKSSQAAYFAFANPAERFFSDHFSRLACAIQRTEGAFFGMSSSIVTSLEADGSSKKELDYPTYQRDSLVNVVLPIRDSGCCLYDISLSQEIPENLFTLLDGSEHLFFQALAAVKGATARIYQPTLDRKLSVEATLPISDESERRYIKDYFMFHSEWLERAASLTDFSKNSQPQARSELHSSVLEDCFPIIVPNKRYEVKQGGSGVAFLAAGFSFPEAEFIWCLHRGVITFSLQDVSRLESFSFAFRLAISGRQSVVTGRSQHLTVAFNGAVVGYHSTNGSDQMLTINLPIMRYLTGNRFRLELIPDHAEPVYSITGDITDPRLLSFKVSSFTLERTSFFHAPVVELGETIRFDTSGRGNELTVQNFYPAEESITWIAGTWAKVHFYIRSEVSRGRINLQVIGRSSLESGKRQSLQLNLNGRDLGAIELQDGISHVFFDFEVGFSKDELIDISLILNHAEAVYDDNHFIIDTRLLGLALVQMSIETYNAEEVFPPFVSG